MLALAPGRRLHREQVIDALWPDLSPDAAAPRLHKAAHYARRALGESGRTRGAPQRHRRALLPDAEVVVDAVEFRPSGRGGAGRGRRGARDGARSSSTPGPCCPTTSTSRGPRSTASRSGSCSVELLRLTGRWEELLEEDPADEQAHLALAQALADRGDVRAALRQLERLDQALRRELGTAPGPQAEALRRPAAPRRPRTPGRRAAPLPRAGAAWSGGATSATCSANGWPAPRRAGGAPCWSPDRPGSASPAVLDLAVALAARAGGAPARGRPRRSRALALRPGARGARRPVPQAPGPARRAGRPATARSSTGPCPRAR